MLDWALDWGIKTICKKSGGSKKNIGKLGPLLQDLRPAKADVKRRVGRDCPKTMIEAGVRGGKSTIKLLPRG